MNIPRLLRPNKDPNEKLEDLLSDKPRFHIYTDDDLCDDFFYKEVIYSSLQPEDLKKLGIVVEKFFRATLELNYKKRVYQIVFDPNLKVCKTHIHFLKEGDFDSNTEGDFKSLIEEFVGYIKEYGVIKGVKEEEEFRQSITRGKNRYWYAVSRVNSYYSPAAIGNFAMNFVDDCIIRNIIFRNVTGRELKRYGISVDKITSIK